MKMTRHRLEQAYYLTRELKMWEGKLDELIQASTIKSPVIKDMPFTNCGHSDKVYEITEKISEKSATIESLKKTIQHELDLIECYILTIDDSLLRQIVQYRCIDFYDWEKISKLVGGRNSADSCRKYYTRNIPK